MDEQLGRPNTKVEPDTNLPASQTFPSFTDEYELKEHNSERSTIDTITSNDVGQDPNAVGFAATADKTLTLSVEAKVSNTSNSPASSPTVRIPMGNRITRTTRLPRGVLLLTELTFFHARSCLRHTLTLLPIAFSPQPAYGTQRSYGQLPSGVTC
jgi:hypothetical protein